MSASIALDVSRLLRRAGRAAPTGIDRIELAYAEHFSRRDETCFAAANATGGIGLLPQRPVAACLGALAAAWRGVRGPAERDHRWRRRALRLRIAPALCRAGSLHRRLRQSPVPPVYLLVSHDHLEWPRPILRLKAASGARLFCLVHDLLPIEFPEYSKPDQQRRHRRRIDTATALADALIVSSSATRNALLPYLARAGREPPVLVAPFGTDPPPAAGDPPPGRPYFVLIGTIEVRKNHILMLNLWRRLAQELGAAAPMLMLIGRRGWFAQPAFDMIDRCPALKGLVAEHSRLDDVATARLLKGARALLLPSFAEGFGLPLAEALALGVPALVSDTPALRETGGAVPEYLDPLDGAGWRAAVIDYAAPDSARREAQLTRLKGWRPTRWPEHFAAVDALIERIVGG